MKRNFILLSIILISSAVLISCNRNNNSPNENESNFSELEYPYLCQKPPGMTPEVFAPGIISTGLNDCCSIFSSDGKEFYFGLGSGPDYIIVCTRVENRNWAKPEICPFTGKYNDSEPSMSYDGKKIVFRSNRPLNRAGKPDDGSDIWIVERRGSTWSEPRRLPFPINSDASDC